MYLKKPIFKKRKRAQRRASDIGAKDTDKRPAFPQVLSEHPKVTVLIGTQAQLSMVVYVCRLSSLEAKAGGWRVLGQPGLHEQTLCQNKMSAKIGRGKEKEGGTAGLRLCPSSPTVLRETPGFLSLDKRPLYHLCLQRPLDFLP